MHYDKRSFKVAGGGLAAWNQKLHYDKRELQNCIMINGKNFHKRSFKVAGGVQPPFIQYIIVGIWQFKKELH